MQKLARSHARILVYGLLADGLDVERLTPQGRQELANALDRVLDLVGEIEIVPDAVAGKPAPSVSSGKAEEPKWRHLKRGSVVTEIARGFAQVSEHPIEEMTAVVIYRHDADGLYWVRNAVEFDDGRFVPFSPDAGKAGDGTGGA